MKKKAIVSLVVVIISLVCSFSVPVHAATVVGVGTMRCSDWTKQNNQTSSNEATKIGLKIAKQGRVGWVLGFLSGLNVQSGGPDILKTGSSSLGDDIEKAVDKYCLAHPTEDVVEAASSVANEMYAQKRK